MNNYLFKFFTKPPVKKLLMDHPNIPGIMPPKTLVVNLTGTLVHTEFIVIFSAYCSHKYLSLIVWKRYSSEKETWS